MIADFNFPGREQDEHVSIVLHRHWFVFTRSVIVLALLAGVPLLVMLVWSHVTSWKLLDGSLSHTLIAMAGGLYYLFLWILIFGFWLDYYLDVFVVTDKRIVDIEQAGLFGRTVAEERLYRIQDVTSDTQGIVATALHYGNVYVQTAGKTERFIFEQVPHPEKVARTILEFTDKIADHIEHEDPHNGSDDDHRSSADHQDKSSGRPANVKAA